MKLLYSIPIALYLALMVVLPHAHLAAHHSAPAPPCGPTCPPHGGGPDAPPAEAPDAPHDHASCTLCHLLSMAADTPSAVVLVAAALSPAGTVRPHPVATHFFSFSPYTEARAPPAAAEIA